MANKPQLSSSRLKVKMIRRYLYSSGSRFGVRRVIKPESASRFDEFAVHSRVGVFQLRLPGFDIDFLMIVEHHTRAALDQ